MIDLNKVINQSMTKIEEEGFVEKVVKKRLEETVSSIVDDLFRSYSDFGKDLKNEVSQQLNINLKELNLAGYNTMVLNAVKEKLDEAIHIQGTEKIKETLDELLSDVKKEYTLSELIDEMKNKANEYGEYNGQEISFHIDPRRDILTFIDFDEEPNKDKYQCKYKIWVNSETGIIAGAEIRDRKFDNRVIMGGLRGFEETLFKIYTTGPKLIIDEHKVDVEYGDPEDDY
jgi:hypothetical protein